MKIFDVNGSQITTDIIRGALKELVSVQRREALAVRMHPTQLCMLDNCGITVSEVTRNPIDAELIETLRPPPRALSGLRIIEDAWLQEDKIRFEYDGQPLIGIVNLARPHYKTFRLPRKALLDKGE